MSKKDEWKFYTDNAGEYRWRRTAPNGEQVGASHEGYKNRSDAIKNAERAGYKKPNG